MKVEEALYAYLSSYADLTALVGTRIYPYMLPQDPVLPAVSYYRVSGPHEYGLSGVAHKRPRFQVSAWAKTYAAAKDVASQVAAALRAMSGPIGGAGGVTVAGAWIDNESDMYEPDTGIWQVSVDAIMLVE